MILSEFFSYPNKYYRAKKIPVLLQYGFIVFSRCKMLGYLRRILAGFGEVLAKEVFRRVR